jgi:hypothetical protein
MMQDEDMMKVGFGVGEGCQILRLDRTMALCQFVLDVLSLLL